jgi:hypothetical protein
MKFRNYIAVLVAGMAISFGKRTAFANIAEGVHADGRKSFKADAATTARHLRYKLGSDANHVAVAGAEAALGVSADEAAAAEDPLTVELFGAAPGTKLGVGSAAIAANDFIVGAASGKFQTLTGIANGTYYVEGKAITACSGNNAAFEFVPCFPYPVTVS